MKKIQNIVFPFTPHLNTKELATVASLTIIALRTPPAAGFDFDIIAARLRVRVVLEKAGPEEEFGLEDADFETAKQAVAAYRGWGDIHPDLMELAYLFEIKPRPQSETPTPAGSVAAIADGVASKHRPPGLKSRSA